MAQNFKHYQTLLSVTRIHIADGADSISEMGGSCDCFEQAVAENREWIALVLVS
jgi:hypothetical protein